MIALINPNNVNEDKKYIRDIALLFFITFTVYYYALTSFFVAEDLMWISLFNQFDLKDFFTLYTPLSRIPEQDHESVIRIVTMGLWALDFSAWGLNPFGYHLTNVSLHFINACLLYFIVYKSSGNRSLGLSSAVLFSIFPGNVEAVAWICGRFDVFSIFFYLSSLLFFIKFVKEKKRTFYFASLAGTFLAILSKEIAYSIPLSIVLWDIICGRDFRNEKMRQRVLWYVPYFAIASVCLVWRIYVFGSVEAYGKSGDASFQITNYINGWILKGLLINFPLRLISPFNYQANQTYWLYLAIIFLAFFGILFFSTLLKKNVPKGLIFSILFVFASVAPIYNMLNGVNRNLQSSRFLYLPSAGFCMAVGYLMFHAFNDTRLQKKLKTASFVFLIAIYSAAAFQHIKIWHESSDLVKEVTVQVRELHPSVHADARLIYLLPYDINGWVIPFSPGTREVTSYAFNYWKPKGTYENLKETGHFSAYSKEFMEQYIRNYPFASTMLLNYNNKTRNESMNRKIHVSGLLKYIKPGPKNYFLLWNKEDGRLIDISEGFMNNLASRTPPHADYSILDINNFADWNIESLKAENDKNILKIMSDGKGIKLSRSFQDINPLDFEEIEIKAGGRGDGKKLTAVLSWNRAGSDYLFDRKEYKFEIVMDNELRSYRFNMIDNLDWSFEKNIRDIDLSTGGLNGNLAVEFIRLKSLKEI